MGSCSVTVDDVVTISCKEHDKVLADGIRQLLKEECLMDAALTFRDTSFKVHRLILAIFLPTFKEHMASAAAMLQSTASTSCAASSSSDGDPVQLQAFDDHNVSPVATQILSMDYVASEDDDVRALIDFVYNGVATVRRDRIDCLRQLAIDLHLEILLRAIGEMEVIGNADQLEMDDASSCVSSDDDDDREIPGDDQSHKDAGGDVGSDSPKAGSRRDDEGSVNYNGLLHPREGSSRTRSRKLAFPVRRVTASSGGRRSKRTTSPKCVTDTLSTTATADNSNASNNDIADQSLLNEEVSKYLEQEETCDDYQLTSESEKEEEEDEDEEEMSRDSDWTPPPSGGSSKRKMGVRESTRTSKTSPSGKRLRVSTRNRNARIVNKFDDQGIAQYCKQELQILGEEKSTTQKNDLEEVAVDEELRVLTEPITCVKCSERFLSEHSLEAHRKTCGQRRLFVCKLCGQGSGERESFEKHFLEVHKAEAALPAKVLWQCSQCDFSCDVRHKLTTHVRRKHIGEKSHKCQHCEYSAFYKSEVDRHVRFYHLKERNCVCEICGERYQKGGYLKLHMRTKHQGIMPYKCHYCGKEFIGRRNFHIHVKAKHTGDAEVHMCHVCGKTATKRWNLQVHMQRVHGQTLESLKLVYGPRKPEQTAIVEKDGDRVTALEERSDWKDGVHHPAQ